MDILRQKAFNTIIVMLMLSLWSSQSLALADDAASQPGSQIQAVADCGDDDPVGDCLVQTSNESGIERSSRELPPVPEGLVRKLARYHAARGPPPFS